MSLIKFEGFDHEAAAADLYAGILSTLIVVGTGQSASIALSTATQYSAGQCLGVTAFNVANNNANAMAIMPFTPAANTVILGAAISLSASVSNGAVIGFVNANVGQVYCYISAGALKVFVGDPTLTSVQLGSTVTSAVASLGWAYVEMQAVIAPGLAGSVTVQINGSTVFSQTGLNTSNDGTTNVTGLLLGTVNLSQTAYGFTSYFDDVYVCDTAGSTPYNTFLGPVRVVTQFPVANGSITNFTGLAHHPNWQNVDDPDMDSDDTYNFSNQSGNIDTFMAGALPGSASGVYAVKVTAAGRIDDSGIRTVQTYLKSGTVISVGANINLVGSYQYFSDMYTLDPNTGTAWTPSGVNLTQFGYKIVPSPGSPVALGQATINIIFIGQANQTSTIVGLISLGQFIARVAMILPVLITSSKSIGTIVAAGTAQQGVNATATLTLAVTGGAALSPGLQFAGSVSIGTIRALSSLLQIGNITATASIIPHWSATINQGLAAAATITMRVSAQCVIAQNAFITAISSLPISAQIVSVQSILTSGLARISALSAVAAASGANASNIHVGLSPWVASHGYVAGNRVASTFGGITNAYQANGTGTSGSVTPNGTGSAFTDGTLTWKYLSHVDFSDLPTWVNSIPQTLTQPIIGLLWNNGTITTTAGTPFLTLGNPASPRVTSSINTITLKPAPGEGIRDSLIGGSTALTFNATKGVSFTLPNATGGINYIDIYDGNVILSGLQFLDPSAVSGSTIVCQENSSSALTLTDCILDGYSQTGGATIVQASTQTFLMTNCLLVDRTSANPTYGDAISVQSNANSIVNCTIVALNAPGTLSAAILDNSSASLVRNCIIMGYQTPIGGGGGPIGLVDHCLFDTATPGGAAVDNGGNLYLKLAANQFISATADFRLKAGADALNTAATDTTNIPNSDDIAGTHRPVGLAWDIGCYE
jgi:hypothetical protein